MDDRIEPAGQQPPAKDPPPESASDEPEETGRGRSLALYAWIVVPALIIGGLLVLTFYRPGDTVIDNPKHVRGSTDTSLANVRSSLARQADLPACRGAVSQLNAHLQQARSEDVPGPLPADQVKRLETALVLDEADVEEMNSSRFTPLDAAHLETCFLLRDAAQSLEVAGAAGRNKTEPAGLQRARSAFEWVCRQVRLEPPPRFDLAGAFQVRFRGADRDRDGFLTKDEVKGNPYFEGQFAAMDRDGDGRISEKELTDFLDRLPPAPPSFVLKRGSGTALERAVVFLALLEQVGLALDQGAIFQAADRDRDGYLTKDEVKGNPYFEGQFAAIDRDGDGKISEKEAMDFLDRLVRGCLLFVPGRGKQPELWACGVVLANEPESVYLFDPRLGLPLPGPKGEGIATLKQAREDPAVLAQLKAEDAKYDVTAQRAKDAEALTHAPLSALAPRMRLLQDRLLREPTWRDKSDKEHPLPPAVRVVLAQDEAGALDAVRKAFVASGGDARNARHWRDGGRILRSFLTKAEGGADLRVPFDVRLLRGFTDSNEESAISPLTRALVLELTIVPWEDFPRFRDAERKLRFDRGPGAGLREHFTIPFLRWFHEPGLAREMVVRGQFDRAQPELGREEEEWDKATRRALSPEKVRKGPEAWGQQLNDGVAEWVEKAYAVYADLPEPQPGQAVPTSPEVQKLYAWRLGEPMEQLMTGAMAEGRGAQVTYQMGLCKHEQAVHLQATHADRDKVRQAWEETARWWKRCRDQYGQRPGALAARRMLGEVRLAQGQSAEAAKEWKEAAALTEDNLEKLGLLWRAGQVKAAEAMPR